MIHTARQNAKFIRLVRSIRLEIGSVLIDPETIAVGILERMWHFTIVNAPRGDIGKHQNEMIAEACGWYGEPDRLIEILVDSGWIDADSQSRLVVHDWHDHAPRHIKQNIGRKGGFVNAKESLDVSCETLSVSSETVSGHLSSQDTREVATPNLTKPNPTKPIQTPPTPSSASVSPETREVLGGKALPPPVPIGASEQPAFPQVRSGRLSFDRRMLPLPTVLDTPEFRVAWDRWLDHRIAKGSVTTEDEARGMLSQFARYGPTEGIEIIRRTIELRGWLSLDWPKEQAARTPKQASKGVFTGNEKF